MSNRIFSDNVAMSELPCMNCLRVEMGERACYNGQYNPSSLEGKCQGISNQNFSIYSLSEWVL